MLTAASPTHRYCRLLNRVSVLTWNNNVLTQVTFNDVSNSKQGDNNNSSNNNMSGWVQTSC